MSRGLFLTWAFVHVAGAQDDSSRRISCNTEATQARATALRLPFVEEHGYLRNLDWIARKGNMHTKNIPFTKSMRMHCQVDIGRRVSQAPTAGIKLCFYPVLGPQLDGLCYQKGHNVRPDPWARA